MAKEQAEAKPAEQANEKKLPIKTIGIMAAVLLIEGAIISAAFLFAGKPSDVKGDTAAIDAQAENEKPIEVLVVAEKFQNAKSGRTYLYDTEIYIVIRKKHQEKLAEQMEQMQASITTDISTIFRRAEPTHLLEPTLATITRQISASLEKRLGPDEEGKSRIDEVLIRKCNQFRSDM